MVTPISFSPLVGSIGDLTRVTPFTHRDNATFTHILAKIVDYLQKTLEPQINTELQRILDEMQTILDGYTADANTTKAQ